MRFQRAKSSGRFCTSWHTWWPTNVQATVAFDPMVPSGVARVAISEFPGRERVTACRCLPERCGGSGATFVQDAGLSLSGSGACGDIRPATPVASSTTAATTTTAFALSRNASGRSCNYDPDPALGGPARRGNRARIFGGKVLGHPSFTEGRPERERPWRIAK